VPYPNEHSCRLRDPGDFEEGSFRRIQVGSGDNEHSAIIGRLKGEKNTTIQTLRYPTETYTEARARARCQAHGGRFEPASDDDEEDSKHEASESEDED